MRRLREILLTQYIGAVTIGLLLGQAISGFVNAIVQAGASYVAIRQTEGVFTASQQFSWKNLITSLISVTLYFLVSLALIRWLYAETTSETSSDTIANSGTQP
jgi:ABC-type multidrug transport system permease subunit